MRLAALLLLASAAWGQSTVVQLKYAPAGAPDSGIVGDVTLRDWPYRAWINQTIYDRIKDPDGNGSGKNAEYDGAIAAGMRTRIAAMRPKPGGYLSSYVMLLAFQATMCEQCFTTWDGALTWKAHLIEVLTNVRNYVAGYELYNTFVVGDSNGVTKFAWDGYTDYAGSNAMEFALAYTLSRNWMTTQQRADAISNIIGGSGKYDMCTNEVKRAPGRLSKSGNTLTLTGSTWDPLVVAGATLHITYVRFTEGGTYIKPSWAGWDQAYQGWHATVASVQSTTQLTINSSQIPDFYEGYYIVYETTRSSTSCGMMVLPAMHGNSPPYASFRVGVVFSEALPQLDWPQPDGGTTATYTINYPLNTNGLENLPDPTPSQPWRVRIKDYNDSEYAEIVGMPDGRTGNRVSLRRGRLFHTNGYGAGMYGQIYNNRFGDAYNGEGLNNREITRTAGYLAIGYAMAGDDPRATTLLQTAQAYFYDNTFSNGRKLYTGWNYSKQGYGYGRGVAFYIPQAFFAQNSVLSPSVDYLSGQHILSQYDTPIYFASPWAQSRWFEVGNSWGDDCQASQSASANCGGYAFWAWLTHPGTDEAKRAWNWIRYHNGYYSRFLATPDWSHVNMYSENRIPVMALLSGYPSAWSFSDHTTGPTHKVHHIADNNSLPDSAYMSFASRSDWSSGATGVYLYAGAGGSDKIGAEGTLTTYGIGKNGWLINGPGYLGRNGGGHDSQQSFTFGSWSNMYITNYTPRVRATAKYASANAVWMANDYKDSWLRGAGDQHGLTSGRTYRHVLHLKSGKELVVVWDDFVKSVSETIQWRTHFSNDGQLATACYPNSCNAAVEKDSTRYTEGNTTVNFSTDTVDSRTSGFFGSASKVLTRWLPGTGVTIATKANFTVGYNYNLSRIVLGTNCSVSNPCEIVAGGVSRTWTASPGYVEVRYQSCTACNGYTFVWYDPAANKFRAAVTNAGHASPLCTGTDVECVSPLGTDSFPANTVQLAYMRYDYGGGGIYYGCGWSQNTGNGLKHFHHLCGGKPQGNGADTGNDSTVPLVLQAAATTDATFWMWHRPTTNLSETADTGTTLTVTGTGANHQGLQISGDDPALVILPRNAAATRATELTFTTTHSGEARLFAAGLQPGSYQITHAGTPINTAIGEGESALYVSGISPGAVTITRTGVLDLTVTTASLPSGTVGQAYNACLAAAGGTAPYTWASIGTALPGWATLNTSTGCITGTPNAQSSTTHQFRTTDAAAQTANSSVLTLVVNGVTPLQIGPCPSNAVQNQAYSFTLTGSNGVAPYTFSHTGTLPTGLTRSGATISGTPTTAGDSSVTLTITDSVGAQHSRACIVTVSAAAPTLNITTTTLAGGTEGVAYSQTVLATGVTGTPAWDISAGSLPTGLSIAEATGVISGTPTTAGTYNFTVRVTDNITNDTQALTIVIASAASPVVASWQGGSVTWGSSTSQTVCSATGGTGPYTYAATGLPDGLSMSSAGLLTGTTTVQPGSYNVTCTATDAVNATSQVQGTISVQTAGNDLTLDVVEAYNTGAMIRIGRIGQPSGATCRVFYSISGGQANSANVTLPTARQVVPLEPLTPGTTYSATAVCGAVTSNPVTFTTPALTGTANVTLTYLAPAFYAVASVDVEVAEGNGAFGAPANTACTANLCEVTLNSLNRGGSYRVRRTYRSSGGAALGNVQIQRIQVR